MHHFGITVKDLDASIRFYHDVLGLQFSNEPNPWFDSPQPGVNVGVPGAALGQVSLLAGDTVLELLASWRWVYFEDRDAYPLELVEIAYHNDEERQKGIADYLASRG